MLTNLDFLLKVEQKFQIIIDTYGMPNITTRPQGFQALSHLILEQQVSISSAQACYDKIVRFCGDLTPELLLSKNDEELKVNCGVSKQKATYIKYLAEKIIQKEIDLYSFEVKSQEEVYQELISLKGIGRWTAEVYLMFCLQKDNVFPVGDIAVQHTMREFFQTETLQEMEDYANKWKPYRSLATYLLWHWYLGKRNRL